MPTISPWMRFLLVRRRNTTTKVVEAVEVFQSGERIVIGRKSGKEKRDAGGSGASLPKVSGAWCFFFRSQLFPVHFTTGCNTFV